MKLKIGDIVCAPAAKARTMQWAELYLASEYPENYANRLIHGSIVAFIGEKRARKWVVRWELDHQYSLHASKSLKLSSQSSTGSSQSNIGGSGLPARKRQRLDTDDVEVSSDDSSGKSTGPEDVEEDNESKEDPMDVDEDDVKVDRSSGSSADLGPLAPPAPAIPEDALLLPHGQKWEVVTQLPVRIPRAEREFSHARLRWPAGTEVPAISRTPWHYFHLMFPPSSTIAIVKAVKRSVDNFDEYEFFQTIGLLLLQCMQPRRQMREWFQDLDRHATGLDSKRPRLPRAQDYGFSMNRDRFEAVIRAFCAGAFDIYTDEDEKADPWVCVRNLIDSYNVRREKVVAPGDTLCIDEDTSRWTSSASEAKYKLGGVPALTKMKLKPVPVSIMLKTLCDADSGIKLAIEIQEGKQRMTQKEFSAFGASTAWCLRLSKPWWHSDRLVVGDSAFASVQTAVELRSRGLHFTGLVKTAHSKFPKKYLQKTVYPERGSEKVRVTARYYGF